MQQGYQSKPPAAHPLFYPSVPRCSRQECSAVLEPGSKSNICPRCRAGMKAQYGGFVRPRVSGVKTAGCMNCFTAVQVPASYMRPDGSCPPVLCGRCHHMQGTHSNGVRKRSTTARAAAPATAEQPVRQSDLPPEFSELENTQLAAVVAQTAAAYIHPANGDVPLDIASDGSHSGSVPAVPNSDVHSLFAVTPGAHHYNSRGEIVVPHLKISPNAIHPYIQRLIGAPAPSTQQDPRFGTVPLQGQLRTIPPPSAPARSRAGTDRSPSSEMRICGNHGCNAIVPPSHVWTVCSNCLAAASDANAVWASSSGPRARRTSTAGRISHQDGKLPHAQRRASAPLLTSGNFGQRADFVPNSSSAGVLTAVDKPRLKVNTTNCGSSYGPASAASVFSTPVQVSSSPSLSAGPPIARSMRYQRTSQAPTPTDFVPANSISPQSAFVGNISHPMYTSSAVPRRRSTTGGYEHVSSTMHDPTVTDLDMRTHMQLPAGILDAEMEADSMLEHVEALLRKHIKARDKEAEELERWVNLTETQQHLELEGQQKQSESAASQYAPMVIDDGPLDSNLTPQRVATEKTNSALLGADDEPISLDGPGGGISAADVDMHDHTPGPDTAGEDETVASNDLATGRTEGDTRSPTPKAERLKDHPESNPAPALSSPGQVLLSTPPPTEARQDPPSSPSGNLGWDSDLSDLTPIEDSTDEGESEIDLPEDGERVRLVIKIPPRPYKSPQKSATERAKHASICNIRRCQNLLPPDSRWKLCEPCRVHNREIQRRRKGKAGLGQPISMEEKASVDLSTSAPGSRICSSRWCKAIIPPVSDWRWKICNQCREQLRRVKEESRSSIVDDDSVKTGSSMTRITCDALIAMLSGELDACNLSKKRARTDDAADNDVNVVSSGKLANPASVFVDSTPTAYQYLNPLLDELRHRFFDFMSTQSQYLTFKLAQGLGNDDTNSTFFRFDGEYSVVANPAGGVVDDVVQDVVSRVQIVLGIQFRPAGVFVGENSTVISRYGCIHELQIPLASSSSDTVSPNASKLNMSVRRMVGEMEVCVSWDRRHQFFPGQRIAVRFVLIG